jgi:hypothetical protein
MVMGGGGAQEGELFLHVYIETIFFLNEASVQLQSNLAQTILA